MDDLFENARWLIGAIARGLEARQGEGVAEVLSRLAEQRLERGRFPRAGAHAACRCSHIFRTASARPCCSTPTSPRPSRPSRTSLHWLQSSSYTRCTSWARASATNYGWAEIIGPDGFFAGDDFLLGLLMLGPDRHYRIIIIPRPNSTGRSPRPAVEPGRRAFVEQPQGAIDLAPFHDAACDEHRRARRCWPCGAGRGTRTRLRSSSA